VELLRLTSTGRHADTDLDYFFAGPNAIAERFIGTLRRECLDHILIVGPRHLAAVLRDYVQHYDAHRPHRSLHQHPPAGDTSPPSGAAIRPLRRDRLGGLIHEYVQVA